MTTRQILRAALPAVGLVLLVGALRTGVRSEPVALTTTGTALGVEGALPSLGGATEWLNSQPLSSRGLRGKVVLVEFGTYTCINWRRTLPYVRAWAEKYKDRGLVVIGVHTPEFGFEKAPENVRREMPALGIHYPVAVDGRGRDGWTGDRVNRPPHRSQRAELPHWAVISGSDSKALLRPRVMGCRCSPVARTATSARGAADYHSQW